MFLKTRRLLVASVLIAFVLSTSAQSNRFGKISDEQWEIAECTYDSTAEALILFDVGMFEYEFNLGYDNKLELSDLTFTDAYDLVEAIVTKVEKQFKIEQDEETNE